MNVDTGQFAAITGQLAELAGEVAGLRSQVAEVATVEAIIRRASWPEPVTRPAAVRQPRPRRLRVVAGGR